MLFFEKKQSFSFECLEKEIDLSDAILLKNSLETYLSVIFMRFFINFFFFLVLFIQ